jgi:hypothetical protein
LGITAVCTGLRVTTETGDLGEVKLEFVLQPVDSIARTTSQYTDKVVACKITGLNK